MTGTKKQIAWAEDIERKAFDDIDANIKVCEDRAEQYGVDFAERAEMFKIFRKAMENLFASEKMQSAAFIISSRDLLPRCNEVIDTAAMIAQNKNEDKISVLKMMLKSVL